MQVDFRIADTFTDSPACLTGEKQKLAKTAAFDPQMNPVNPVMQLHRIEQSKDNPCILWGLCRHTPPIGHDNLLPGAHPAFRMQNID